VQRQHGTIRAHGGLFDFRYLDQIGWAISSNSSAFWLDRKAWQSLTGLHNAIHCLRQQIELDRRCRRK
jgi:hypothetical protein